MKILSQLFFIVIITSFIISYSFESLAQESQSNSATSKADEPSWWVILVIGAIVSNLLQYFFAGIIPSKIREKLYYVRKSISKIIRRTRINVQLVSQTLDISTRKVILENVKEDLRISCMNNSYDVSMNQNSLMIKVPIGKNKINSKVTISTTVIDGKEVSDLIECNIEQECAYNKFVDDVFEMREAQKKIESMITEKYPNFNNKSNLICHLNSICQLTGAFSELKINSFNAKLSDKINIDLNQNEVIITCEDINKQILSFLKKIITLYY